jgi:hypothetical protein
MIINEKPVIDPALLNAAQPITIALPEMDVGIKCSISDGNRQGLIEKKYGYVVLPPEAYKIKERVIVTKKLGEQFKGFKKYQSGVIETLKLLFVELNCLYREYESYFSLTHPKEKTPGGWIIYHNNLEYISHRAQGSLNLFEWLYKYHGISKQDYQDRLVQIQLEEIGVFYPHPETSPIVLRNGEFLKDAIDDGRVRLKEGQINFISSPTGTGKGYLAEYLCQWSDLPLLAIDGLRRLVQQTYDRLIDKGINTVHYETKHPAKAKDCKALAICTPSVNQNKRVIEYFLNRSEDTKINVLMDEAHLLAKQLFDFKQLYPRFYEVLEGRVETIVTMTATPTQNSNTLIRRLQRDFYGHL